MARVVSAIDLGRLTEPFPAADIEWRVGRSGIASSGKPWAFVLAYVTARAVQQRLDEVCGPENWRPEYVFHQGPGGGVVCKLWIRVDGEWIAKEDGAEQTDIEAFKGGISGALKRAASVWGLGRYLYGLEESFARFVEDGTQGAYKVKVENKWLYWLPPELPSWALPSNEQKAPPAPSPAPAPAKPKAPAAKSRIVHTPATVPVAGSHPLDEFVLTLGVEHKNKTFKQIRDEIGAEAMVKYFQKSQKYLDDNKAPISPAWQEVFSKAEEYLFGAKPSQEAK
jgi:hypothetical protein